MKKFIISIILILTFITPSVTFSANCDVGDNIENVGNSLDDCLSGSNLIKGDNAKIEEGVKDLINNWVKNIGTVLGLIAVGSIVYGSLLLVVSAGEDEKIKKAKDVIKWGIIGFIGLIFASSIIILLVNVMYSIETT